MHASLGRYLWLRLTPTVVVANVVVNTLFALGIYPAGRPVPMQGPTSVAADLGATAFCVGFFTMITAIPGARLEAQAGRVRGFGWSWLRWPLRHPVICSILLGVALTPVAGATVASLEHAGHSSLSRGDFTVLKAAFATLLALPVAIGVALMTIAAEAPVDENDPRWCHHPAAPVGGPVYPSDNIDKAGLGVTDNALGCSATPTWYLVVRGALDPEHVRIALADVVTRYPSLATRVQSLDGVPPWATRYRYAHDPAFRVDGIFRVHDLRADPSRLTGLLEEEQNRPLDLYTQFPVTLTMAITGADRCHLFFRQHHAIADGRAFIGLLVDFATYLEAARKGLRPSPIVLSPIGRRSEAEPLGFSRGRELRDTVLGVARFLGRSLRAVARPIQPMKFNRSNDYTGVNGTVHWIVSDTVLDQWAPARQKLDVSLNSLLTGAFTVAAQRWHREQGLPVGRTGIMMLMETRPRDGSFVSFANHLATIEVLLPLNQLADPAAIARSIQREAVSLMKRGEPIQRLLGERFLVGLIPVAEIHRIIFESKRPTGNLNFSNLIPLRFPTLQGDGWEVEEVRITTPVGPRNGIALTAIRYNQQLTFNFNFKSSAATREETARIAQHFVTALEELTGVPAAGRWTYGASGEEPVPERASA
jgi:hypothetical protein